MALEQTKTPGSGMGVKDFERIGRGITRRIDDPEALGQMMEAVAAMERELAAAALRLHDEGFSFTDLARANGTTRQTAQERWTKAWKKWGLK
jgi:hypothetical protein